MRCPQLVLRCLLILLCQSIALIPIVWAILHHVDHKATSKASIHDSVTKVGRMVLATVFTSTLPWGILLLPGLLDLMGPLPMLLTFPLGILNNLVVDIFKLLSPSDCFLEGGR